MVFRSKELKYPKANKRQKKLIWFRKFCNKTFMCLVKKEKNKLRNFAGSSFVQRSRAINLWVYWIFFLRRGYSEKIVLKTKIVVCTNLGLKLRLEIILILDTIKRLKIIHESLSTSTSSISFVLARHRISQFYESLASLSPRKKWLCANKKLNSLESDKFRAIFRPTGRVRDEIFEVIKSTTVTASNWLSNIAQIILWGEVSRMNFHIVEMSFHRHVGRVQPWFGAEHTLMCL